MSGELRSPPYFVFKSNRAPHIESLPPELRAFPACEALDERFDDLELGLS